jgi:KUP system potassium uptake protein
VKNISHQSTLTLQTQDTQVSHEDPLGEPQSHHHRSSLAILALTALGVVFGDIGTSPLYALRECFHGPHRFETTPQNVLGVLSMVFWSGILVITLKYVFVIMRADNRGEGGILALEALAGKRQNYRWKKAPYFIMIFGIFGAALLYGDGMITPAISVLSALEGLKVATPMFDPFVVPLTVAILVALFCVQRFGTSRIGIVFGPITFMWFLALAVLGVKEIVQNPQILQSVNPIHAFNFFANNGWFGFGVLGTVFLTVTGGEAMYADMGHFGRKPIGLGWVVLVFPCLMLNYFGQGALLLSSPEMASNPFFNMVPEWGVYPMVGLATCATVIASQALISGTFSLARQAVQLGYCPRMAIIHTSHDEIGQIYVPFVNWTLLGGAALLVIGFGNSSDMAAAYGIAVSMTMFVTTILASLVAVKVWKWPMWSAIAVFGVFSLIDISFVAANSLKIIHGGWIPLAIAAVLVLLMTTWITGRTLLSQEMKERSVSLDEFLEEIESTPPLRVPGTAIFMTGNRESTPLPLVNNLKHNKVLHEKILLVTFSTREIPHVPLSERVSFDSLGFGVTRISVKIGFMDDANVQAIIHQCCALGHWININEVTFFLGREIVLPTKKVGMALWREKLFAFLGRNAQSPSAFFNIPPNQVIEVGMQVEI